MISVDWTLGLQFINFVILLLVLNKILYQPLQKIMTERRQNIDGSHAKVKSLEVSIEDKMKLYQQQLNEARTLANEERNRLRKIATTEETKILGEANAKATIQLNTIKTQVAVEAGKASQTLKGDVQTLAGQITTKILGRELA